MKNKCPYSLLNFIIARQLHKIAIKAYIPDEKLAWKICGAYRWKYTIIDRRIVVAAARNTYATLKRVRSLRWNVVRSVEGVILFQYQSACGSM